MQILFQFVTARLLPVYRQVQQEQVMSKPGTGFIQAILDAYRCIES